MSTVNIMYQYSLNSYLEVFEYSLKNTPRISEATEQLEKISESLNENLYAFGCLGDRFNLSKKLNVIIAFSICIRFILIFSGMFESHKLLFSFMITINLEKHKRKISQEQINFFIKDLTFMKANVICPIPWLPEKVYNFK